MFGTMLEAFGVVQEVVVLVGHSCSPGAPPAKPTRVSVLKRKNMGGKNEIVKPTLREKKGKRSKAGDG